MKIAEWGVAGAMALALALGGTASANSTGPVTAPEYLEYLTQLRAGFEEGEPKPLSNREQKLFDDADQNIRSILSATDNVEDLPQDQAVALFNSQEQIKAILSGAEDTQVICKREARAGTNFRQKRCISAATRDEQREAAQELLRRFPTWHRTSGVN